MCFALAYYQFAPLHNAVIIINILHWK